MEWKPIEKYEGLYLVSDTGKVFSVRNNRLLKLSLNNAGYYGVEFNIRGKVKKEFVHRLVAEAFLPNPNNYPVVNHKDENPKNNNVSNLEWCTHKYNTNYGTCIQRMTENRTYHSGEDNVKSKAVYQFDLEGNFIARFGGVREASRQLDISSKSISKCCTGVLKQYNGFVFQYDENFRGYREKRKQIFKGGAMLVYDLQGNLVKRYDDAEEFEKDGFNQIQANRVCRGERNSYKGYKFKHEE